jgi:hypothetical protein
MGIIKQKLESLTYLNSEESVGLWVHEKNSFMALYKLYA